MTPDEVTDLTTAMGVYDGRLGGDTDDAFWFRQVGDLDYADALEVVHRHYAGSGERITHADVRRGVESMRASRRTPQAVTARPPIDPDDTVAYMAWLRGAERAIGDGQQPPTALPPGRAMRGEVTA